MIKVFVLNRIIDTSWDFGTSSEIEVVDIFTSKKAAERYLKDMPPRERSYHDYEIVERNPKA